MPDKPVTVAAYAAGASLAAITLFYVFGPTFFIDGDGTSMLDGRKRTIIGLSNPANDCFINSVLQALAGLGDLRLYVIKELHRRQLDGSEIYETLPLVLRKGENADKIKDLQRGPVTKALKDMLDALNERPIYKKTITARPIIEALEKAYRTRINRNQQDAQEFLQIVLERLNDEYHAAEKARKRFRDGLNEKTEPPDEAEMKEENQSTAAVGSNEGFPFEGRFETQIQCMYCGFKTKPSISTFVSLTLNVPQASSTTLDKCFDSLLKSEEIDEYKCDKCRLRHAIEWKKSKLGATSKADDKDTLEADVSKLEKALIDDPEIIPKGVEMPDSTQAPKRKIKKHTRITVFPKVIAIHLSRSVFETRSVSTKNLAKVSYTERLRLGGILDEHWYRLLGVVCHKGSHSSGHYESFRRNHVYPPFATPDAFSAYAAASKASSIAPSPTINSHVNGDQPSNTESGTSLSSPPATPASTRPNSGVATTNDTSSPNSKGTKNSPVTKTVTETSKPQIQAHETNAKYRRRKKVNDRWWRISDDKIKEAKTSDVLGMQKEVYLLFYELERPGSTVDL